MSGFGQLMAYGAGSMCLGAGLTLAVIVSIGTRHGGDGSDGCLGWVLVLPFLLLSAYLFTVAV